MNRRSMLLGALVLPTLAACASVDTEQVTTTVGVIETVDPTSREILIRGDGGAQSGALLSMVVGRAVQRINMLRPGDRVTVRYYQAIAARVASPLSTATPGSAVFTAERDADRPGGELTRVRSGRVTITAVNSQTGTISFTGPGGVSRTVTPRNAEVLSFTRSLRVGQQVDITYEEALAISVEPMRS
jgi:hypothetical protein